MIPQRRSYRSLAAPLGPYAHAVRHGDLLFVSGLTAFGTPAQHGSVVQQAEAILDRLAAVAHEEDRDLRSLVKVTIFVTELEDVGALRDVLARHYGGTHPASSLVRVAGLVQADLKIEIEAILSLA